MIPEEGKAIPDWQYVKAELLQSSFNADVLMASYISNGKRDKNDLNDAVKWIIDLYLKLKPKIDTKKDDYKVLDKINDFVYDGKKVDFKDWMDCLNALNIKLDDLGVTKIELPPKKKMKNVLM